MWLMKDLQKSSRSGNYQQQINQNQQTRINKGIEKRIMDKNEAVNNVGMYLEQGFHCSEAFVKGMGDLFPKIDMDCILKASTGFAGGIGMTKQNACGLLVGGVMIISSLLGRTELKYAKGEVDPKDVECQKICAEYRAKFLDALKATKCCEIRVMGYGSPEMPCSKLGKTAANIFLDVCEEHGLL